MLKTVIVGKGMIMKRIQKTLLQLVGSAEGNILIMAAFAIPMLILVAGLAIDVNRYVKNSGYLQSAIDQAALAAAAVDNQDRTDVANRFLQANLSRISGVQLVGAPQVSESFPPGGPLEVEIAANFQMNTSFAAFFGVSSLDINLWGSAQRQVQDVEAVLALASSGTMCANKNRNPDVSDIVPGDVLVGLTPDNNCVHFNAVKQGAQRFVDMVNDNSTVAHFKVGLVPYNQKVRMPDVNQIPPTMAANEPAGTYADFTNVTPLSVVEPLTSDMTKIANAINGMNQTPAGLAWSRSDLGAHVAGLMLDPSQTQYFRGGETPKDFADATVQKILILMSDGSNIGCCFTNWPIGNFNNQYVYNYTPYNSALLEVCQELKNQGVKIFTILLDVDEADTGGAEINDVFARCASGAYMVNGVSIDDPAGLMNCQEKQHCYNVADDQQLINAYTAIAQTFYRPTIAE